MDGLVSITGEIALLWQDVDPYHGDVILLSLDTDDVLALNTFELAGPLAARFIDGVLAEGMRVRIDCRQDIVEVVSPDTGETSDAPHAVVVDVTVLPE